MHTMTPSERNFSPGAHVAIERLSTSYCNLMRTVLYCKATLAGSTPTCVSFGLADCLLPVCLPTSLLALIRRPWLQVSRSGAAS